MNIEGVKSKRISLKQYLLKVSSMYFVLSLEEFNSLAFRFGHKLDVIFPNDGLKRVGQGQLAESPYYVILSNFEITRDYQFKPRYQF